MERTREQLFAVLLREHEPGLLAFVRACVYHPGDADDLVQDTFLAAWQQLHEYDLDRPFAGWLRGIAKHKVIDYFRACQTGRRRVHSLPPEAVAAVADELERLNRPPRGEVYRDCFAALRTCLEALPERDREVVERAYRQRQNCTTIADQLGHTADAVRKRLQRARAALRDCILSKLQMEAVDV